MDKTSDSPNQIPANFFTSKSLESPQSAGIGVWIICSVIISFDDTMSAYQVRLIAMGCALFWSFCLFLKRREWNVPFNYLLLLVNAAFILINAAGINTVTRQSPLEGMGINSNLKDIKGKVVASAIFDLEDQLNWYPDYEMIKYIDTLKASNLELQSSNGKLRNEFSFLKDNIGSFTKDKSVISGLQKELYEFGRSHADSSDFPVMQSHYKFKIDSIQHELDFRNAHPITKYLTTSDSYSINGVKYSADEVIKKQNRELDSTENANISLQRRLYNTEKGVFALMKNGILSYKLVDSLYKVAQ